MLLTQRRKSSHCEWLRVVVSSYCGSGFPLCHSTGAVVGVGEGGWAGGLQCLNSDHAGAEPRKLGEMAQVGRKELGRRQAQGLQVLRGRAFLPPGLQKGWRTGLTCTSPGPHSPWNCAMLAPGCVASQPCRLREGGDKNWADLWYCHYSICLSQRASTQGHVADHVPESVLRAQMCPMWKREETLPGFGTYQTSGKFFYSPNRGQWSGKKRLMHKFLELGLLLQLYFTFYRFSTRTSFPLSLLLCLARAHLCGVQGVVGAGAGAGLSGSEGLKVPSGCLR